MSNQLSPITTIVRAATRTGTDGSVLICTVIALMSGGCEKHIYQVVRANPENGRTAMFSEKHGGREYVMEQFDAFLADC